MTVTSAFNNNSLETAKTFSDFMTAANMSVGGWLFTGIDVLVFLILFITLSAGFGWQAALLSSSFIALIMSLLMVYMGVVSWIVPSIFVGILVVTIMYTIWSNKYD